MKSKSINELLLLINLCIYLSKTYINDKNIYLFKAIYFFIKSIFWLHLYILSHQTNDQEIQFPQPKSARRTQKGQNKTQINVQLASNLTRGKNQPKPIVIRRPGWRSSPCQCWGRIRLENWENTNRQIEKHWRSMRGCQSAHDKKRTRCFINFRKLVLKMHLTSQSLIYLSLSTSIKVHLFFSFLRRILEHMEDTFINFLKWF